MNEEHGRDIEVWTRDLAAARMSRRRWLGRVLGAGLSLPTAAALLGRADVLVGRADAQTRLRVFNVPKFTGFVFFELAKAGSQKACDELGADLTYVGTTTADVEGQVQVIRNIIPQRPDAIVTAALDINAPVPALRQARQRGAVVVTFDSDVAPDGRDFFVNMAAFETQARAMLESALYNAPEGGEAIWVAPTPTVANFISQKKALDKLIAEDPRYKSVRFIDTLYANDDPEKSYQVATSAMQAHPGLKLFVSGSGISNPAINKAIKDTGRSGKVFSTGFALPSTMKTYLEDGTCKQYALWSPSKFGYMATYLAIMLKSAKIEHKPGTKVDIPTVGPRGIDETFTANLDNMLFFRKGNDDFENGIPMSA